MRRLSSDQDGFTIRHFQPEDIDQVKAVFAAGMIPLIWEAFKTDRRSILTDFHWRHPFIITAPLLGMGWQQGWDRFPLIFIGAALTVFFLSSTISFFKMRKEFHGYIQQSVETDLSSIPSVYQTNGGSFLVAVDTQNEVLGMVGGELKEDNDGRKTFELRRMSVDPRARGQGLAKRLVQRLEKDLDNMSTLFLTCSSIQYAANRLYKSQGFLLTKEDPFPGMAFKLRRFEKEY
jgi:ribosomal protein S18 acetylase RimI-like enzyme